MNRYMKKSIGYCSVDLVQQQQEEEEEEQVKWELGCFPTSSELCIVSTHMHTLLSCADLDHRLVHWPPMLQVAMDLVS